MTLAQLVDALTSSVFWPIFVVFLRCGAAASVLPGFGEQTVPMRVKLSAALAISIPVAIFAPISLPPPESTGAVARICMTETIIGLILGMALRSFLMAMQTAGSMAAQSTSLAQLSGGAFPDPLPGIGQLLSFAALTLLMISGFPERVVIFFALSYELFPASVFPFSAAVTNWGIQVVGQSFALAFQLAAPFVVLSLLYNITLGAINRAMPQLMVALVGAPVITGVALLILCVAAPSILTIWYFRLDMFLNNPVGLP